MQPNKWTGYSQSNKENVSGLKLKPGLFSNPGDITAAYHNDPNLKLKAPSVDYRHHRDLSANLLTENYTRPNTMMTDLDVYPATYDLGESQFERFSNNDSFVSHRPLGERTNLPQVRQSRTELSTGHRNVSSDKVLRSSDSSARVRKNNSYAQLSKSTAKHGSQPISTLKKEYGPKTPTPVGKRSQSREPENNENIDMNLFMAQQGFSKMPSRQSVEKDRKSTVSMSIQRQEAHFDDETEELRAELKRTVAELQAEKNKSNLLENELATLTSGITEERSKYQMELMKISQQIKKLRNIQNIYVNEKKNSEKLEGQLNAKEKALQEVSDFLCECLKSMVSTLELLLVKGDYNIEKQVQGQDFSLENYLKLFYEIRRLLIPKLETAENSEFHFEWRNQDYKQVLYTTKELMKSRKATNFKVGCEKPIQDKSKGPSHCSSKANSFRSQNMPLANGCPSNTTYNYSVTNSQVPSELNSVKESENPLRVQNVVKNSVTDLKSTRASSQLQNDYVPMQNRIDTHKDEDPFEQICSEDLREELFNQRNHLGGKLTESTSTFDNLVNIGSGNFNNKMGTHEGFDQYLAKQDSHKELPTFNAKNYDMPLAQIRENSIILRTSGSMKNLQVKTDDGALEAVKNKILKRKSDIEARRNQNQETLSGFKQPTFDSAELSPINADSIPAFSNKENQRTPEHQVQGKHQLHSSQKTPSPTKKTLTKNSMSKSSTTLSQQTTQNGASNNKKEGSPTSKGQVVNKIPLAEKTENLDGQQLTEAEYAIAKFDYDPQKENDLAFSKGERIQVLKKTKSGWWIGLCHNKIGYFPFNFVNLVEP